MEILDLNNFNDSENKIILSNSNHFIYYKLIEEERVYPFDLTSSWAYSRLNVNKKPEMISYEHYSILRMSTKDSFNGLYCRLFNPIYLSVYCQTGEKELKNDNGEQLYKFTAMIYSIDDSAFGTEFESLSYNEIEKIRYKFFDWIESKNNR